MKAPHWIVLVMLAILMVPPVVGQEGKAEETEQKPESDPGQPKASDGFDASRSVVKATVADEEKPTPKPQNVPKPQYNGNPERDLFDHAELLFKHEYWILARQQYQKYVTNYARGPNAQASFYKIAECYTKLGDASKADVAYEQVIRNFANGPYVGAAAYRLAEVRYRANDFQRALPYYTLAEQRSEKEIVRISAAYYRARCLHQTQAVRGAEEAYRRVSEATSDNPDISLYRDASLLALARMEVVAGRNQEALAKFVRLTDPTTQPRVRAEAVTKAGVLSQELGLEDEAARYFQEILGVNTADAMIWHPMALAGLLTYFYKREQFREVLDYYQKHKVDFSKDERAPAVFLVVGHAYRRLGEYSRATALYEGVERAYPDSPEAKEASYRKLLCMHKSNDPQLGYHLDEYLKKQRLLGTEDSLYFSMATLLRGESLFNEGQRLSGLNRKPDAKATFNLSADAYLAVKKDKVPEKYHASLLFKRGWALMEAERYDKAIESFTDFIASYGTSEWLAQAYAKRAECHTRLKNFDAAARDCDELLAKFPNDRIAQAVLQRKALVEVERHNPEGTLQAFRSLLERFPDTRGKAEAHFFMGKALQEQEEFEEAIKELSKSREMDPAAYHEHATSAIIVCHYKLSHMDEMAKEVDVLLGNDPKSSRVSPKLLNRLGAHYFEREDFNRAARYFFCVANYEKPTETQPEVWNLLGRSLLKSGKPQEAIIPFDNYLASDSVQAVSERKAKALLNKATALSKVAKYKEAQACGEEALQLQSEGRVNAQANLLLGDVAFAQKDFDFATKYYGVVSALFDDDQLAPEALEKAARAFEQLNDPQKAADKRRELRTKYPKFLGLKE